MKMKYKGKNKMEKLCQDTGRPVEFKEISNNHVREGVFINYAKDMYTSFVEAKNGQICTVPSRLIRFTDKSEE